MQETSVPDSIKESDDEACIMERKWAESLRTKRISGYFPGDRCRYILRTGDKDAGGAA